MKIRSLSVVPLLFLTAISCIAGTTKEELAGTYVGHFAGGTSHFILYRNGTYWSDFQGKALSKTAKRMKESFQVEGDTIFKGTSGWSIEERNIRFVALPSAFDFQRTGFPTIHQFTTGAWDPKQKTITFDGQPNYRIQKVSDKFSPPPLP